MEGIRRKAFIEAFIEEVTKRVISGAGRVKSVGERRGEKGSWTLIAEMEKEENKEKVLRRRDEIRRRWGLGVEENLMLDERRMRWRIMEAAKRERARGEG